MFYTKNKIVNQLTIQPNIKDIINVEMKITVNCVSIETIGMIFMQIFKLILYQIKNYKQIFHHVNSAWSHL